MKKWRYSVSTNRIWASFDYGEVEAETYEEAEKKAVAELTTNFAMVNLALALNASTDSFTISFDKRDIEIEEVK